MCLPKRSATKVWRQRRKARDCKSSPACIALARNEILHEMIPHLAGSRNKSPYDWDVKRVSLAIGMGEYGLVANERWPKSSTAEPRRVCDGMTRWGVLGTAGSRPDSAVE